MRAVRGGAVRPSMVAASVARDSGMDFMLGVGGCLDIGARNDALGEPGEDLAGPDLDESLGTGVVERKERLAPPDRADERLGELLPDVAERLRGGAGEDGEPRLAQLDLAQRGAERLDGWRPRRRV